MKVLLVHNFYGSEAPSGENEAFRAEAELLRSNGHPVIEFTRKSDEIRRRGLIGTLQGGMAVPFNPFMEKKIRRLIGDEQPDIMHVHNTFPLLSPAIFRAAHGSHTATVLTLHNFRLGCASAIPMRGGAPCILCLSGRSSLPGLKYGCYRKSILATFPLTVMIALHKKIGTWNRSVDAFIALTGFQRDILSKVMVPREKVYLKPHVYPNPPLPLPWGDREDKVVYVGRISEEKGLDLLIEAWKVWGAKPPSLEIIGEGEMRDPLEKNLRLLSPLPIRFLGQLPFEETQRRLARAKLLVLPSRSFEGFPMVIREAFASGVPVVTSRFGSLAEIVQDGVNGLLVAPNSSRDLFTGVKSLWMDQPRLSVMASRARTTFECGYSASSNYTTLMGIYEAALSNRRKVQS